MPVAWDDLGGNRLDAQAHFLRHEFFNERFDIGEGAHRAGNGASGNLLHRPRQADAVAGELGVKGRQRHAESRRLGMDAVAAADLYHVLGFHRTALEHVEQPVDIRQQQLPGAFHLHRKAGVQQVGAGHTLMQEARFRPNISAQMGEKKRSRHAW